MLYRRLRNVKTNENTTKAEWFQTRSSKKSLHVLCLQKCLCFACVFACAMDLIYETVSLEFLAMCNFTITFWEKNNTIVNIINQKQIHGVWGVPDYFFFRLYLTFQIGEISFYRLYFSHFLSFNEHKYFFRIRFFFSFEGI